MYKINCFFSYLDLYRNQCGVHIEYNVEDWEDALKMLLRQPEFLEIDQKSYEVIAIKFDYTKL